MAAFEQTLLAIERIGLIVLALIAVAAIQDIVFLAGALTLLRHY
jgi:hypothetical protein